MVKEIQMLLNFSRDEIEKKSSEGATINTTELAERLKALRESFK
jgi:hypothetical protein